MRNKIINFLYHAITIVWLALICIPIVPVIIGSFKSSSEYYSSAPLSLANEPTLSNYIEVITSNDFLISILNTIILIVLSIIITTILSSMVAYAVERFEFKYKQLVISLFVVISFLPMAVMQISVFQVMNFTHLNNTFWGLAILYSISDVVIIYLFRDNIRKISLNIDKSAKLSGANYFQIYWKLIFPNLRPTIMIVCIYKLINIYNDFYLQSLYLTKHKTISTLLYQYTSPYEMSWPQICASIVVLIIVSVTILIIVQLFYQKQLRSES